MLKNVTLGGLGSKLLNKFTGLFKTTKTKGVPIIKVQKPIIQEEPIRIFELEMAEKADKLYVKADDLYKRAGDLYTYQYF